MEVRKNFLLILVIFCVILSTASIPASAEEQDTSYLNELKASNYSGSLYFDKWYSESFQDINGEIVTNGVGQYTSGGTAVAVFNIAEMGYTKFAANLSLDSKYVKGDFGKTAAAVYVDDRLLYEKQLSPNLPIQSVELKLPENAKNLVLVIKQLKGAKGTHTVVWANARLTNDGAAAKVSDNMTQLASIGAKERGGSYYVDQWYNEPFQDVAGNLITSGIGQYTSGGTALVTFNIDQMGFDRFEADLSVDSKWTQADYGKSAVGVYADDQLIYEKQLSSKQPVQKVSLVIPANTVNLTLVVKQLKGAKGTEGIVWGNARILTKKGVPAAKKKISLLSSIGSESNTGSYYVDQWYNEPFQSVTGDLITTGIGLYSSSYSGGQSTARYNIAGMGFNHFSSKVTLDSKWVNGDYGQTKVSIYADGKLVYARQLIKASGVINVEVGLPAGTKLITLSVNQINGAKGVHNVIFANAAVEFRSASTKLTASQVTVSKAGTVTVKDVKSGSIVKVYNGNGAYIGESKANSTGTAVVTVSQSDLKAGTLYVTNCLEGKTEGARLTVKHSTAK